MMLPTAMTRFTGRVRKGTMTAVSLSSHPGRMREFR